MSTALWKTHDESFWATALLENSVVHLYDKNLSMIFWYMFYLNSAVENCTKTSYSQLLQKITDLSTSFSTFQPFRNSALIPFEKIVIGAAGRWHCHSSSWWNQKNIFHSFCSLLAVHFYSRITHWTFFLHILFWNQYRVGIQFAKVFKPNICLKLIPYTFFFFKKCLLNICQHYLCYS